MSDDLLPMLLVTVLGAVLVGLCSTGFSSREKKWVGAAFFLHVAFACAQVPIAYGFYGGSDMFLYFSYGDILARMMAHDPIHVIPEVTALLLQQPLRLPLTIIGAGTATGSMSALAAWSFYIFGPSKYATGVAFAMLSLCGKIAMYRVFRANVAEVSRFAAAVATLFLPSFVFWSAGLIKEAVAVTGLGWSLFGLHLWIRRGRTALGWVLMALGTMPILIIKPYIMFPFVVAGGAWYYWSRSLKRGRLRIRPLYLAMAALLGYGGVVFLAQYFPEYAPETFGTRAYELQSIGRGMRGGSNFLLSGEIPTTFAGQLAYAPAALFTSLFRPVIFEVSNLMMLANAVETTVLAVLTARIFFVKSVGGVRRQIAEDPFLLFCLVFVVAFGMAVGLTSTNLGTLSRYRSPLLPFFVVLLLALGSRHREVPAEERVRSASGTMLHAA